jgi:hypothetical protein
MELLSRYLRFTYAVVHLTFDRLSGPRNNNYSDSYNYKGEPLGGSDPLLLWHFSDMVRAADDVGAWA